MATTVEQLEALQGLDIRIMKLDKELQDIPAKKQELEAQNDKYRVAVDSAKSVVGEFQAKAKERELAAETQRNKILKLREQQLGLKTNKEFKAMEHEIQGLEDKISEIEDDELRVLEDADAGTSGLRDAEKTLAEAQERMGLEVAEQDTRKEEISTELATLSEKRRILAEQVDSWWLHRYQSIMDNKKDAALVRLEHGVCGGCNMKLPPHVVHDARKGDHMVVCSYCARLLY